MQGSVDPDPGGNDLAADGLGHRHGPQLIRSGEHRRKLIPGDPRQHIGAAQLRGDHPGHLDQGPLRLLPAEPFADRAEMVDVEQQDRQGAVLAPATVKLLFSGLEEWPAVGQAGEGGRGK